LGIGFSLRESEHVSLRAFDARGRLVRVLSNGVLQPGAHVLHWDGIGADGTHVPPGVYFYKLETGHRSTTGKMVLLR
jgi:flagellar hook assembly protein FlgD